MGPVENAHGLKNMLAQAVEAVKEGRGAVMGVLLEDDEDVKKRRRVSEGSGTAGKGKRKAAKRAVR